LQDTSPFSTQPPNCAARLAADLPGGYVRVVDAQSKYNIPEQVSRLRQTGRPQSRRRAVGTVSQIIAFASKKREDDVHI
jgi:hypothetical protein